MKIEVGDSEILRGADTSGIRTGSKYPVCIESVRGEVCVAHEARFRNPSEQYSETEIRDAIRCLIGIETRNAVLQPGFVLYLTKLNATSVGLTWQPLANN